MSTTQSDMHPDEFHAPGWDEESKRPIIDGKYNDPKTGELREAKGMVYSGPPAVDLVVMNLHEATANSVFRIQQAFPVERILYHVMKVVHAGKIQIDSLTATQYAVRIVLAHELTQEGFDKFYGDILSGVWD